MWTGLGVIFFVILLAIPVIKWIGIFLVGSASEATNKVATQKKIDEANKQKRAQAILDQNRIMDKRTREYLMEQEPETVTVGERYDLKRVWKDGKGWVYPCTIENKWFYWKSKRKKTIWHKREYTAENGYTQNLSEYLRNIEFIDEVPNEEWIVTNYLRYDQNAQQIYSDSRKQQCEEYCETLSMLAHRYIYFGEYTEFRSAFIRVLIEHTDVALNFIKECHAANVWREENKQIYDCDNYLQDFMQENRIKDKVEAIIGHEVKMPDDFRHYRPDTPSPYAAKHIEHELKKRGRVGQAAEIELKSQGWWGAAFISTIVGILFLIWFFNSPTDDFTIHIKRIGFVLGMFAWAMVVGMAAAGSNASEEVKKEDEDEQYYTNMFPEESDCEGKAYAKTIVEEILQHPMPYKYYSWRH